MDINTIRELKLTPEQLEWVLNQPYKSADEGVLYRESEALRIQVTKAGDVFRIITWE